MSKARDDSKGFQLKTSDSHEPLARRLNTPDAVVLGLGAMIGAGVFAAVGPAADSAGTLLLIGLGAAAMVAYANATSSAQLASLYPESGGTYVYARERLGEFWGFLAGWGFVIGKIASLAVMGLTFGAYVHPQFARPLGIGAIVLLTAVNYLGVKKTAGLTRLILAITLGSLAMVVVGTLLGGDASIENLRGESDGGALGVLQAGGLLFFAFAGYARIATLGEEVRDPERTIPRAIPLALGIVVAIYALVMGSALIVLGAESLAVSKAPLAAAVRAGRYSGFAPVVGLGAATASAGVLLSLLAGVSRTVLAMARRGELPRFLASVHPRYETPHRAEAAVGLVVCGIVLVADLRDAIGFSSFAVLIYYGLTNASAWTLTLSQRRRSRFLPALGAFGCFLLAFTLPVTAIFGGTLLLAVGSLVWLVRRRSLQI